MTEQEQQLLTVLRENADAAEFRLVIERRDGAWDIALSGRETVGAKEGSARGVGATFDAAWDDMSPLWA